MVEIITQILVILFLFFAQSSTKATSHRYEENNFTTSSYSMFIYIDEIHNKIFENAYFDKENEEVSRGEQFKNEILKQFNSCSKNESIKIARVDLVFDNRELI